MKLTFVDSINKISKQAWQNNLSSNCPFLQYDYFDALETSLSTCPATGWHPHHLVIESHNEIVAIMPLYLKEHSWGEYVFDWAWAEAYEKYNLEYYPKLVNTIPFTPVTTDKLLSQTMTLSEVFPLLIEYAQQHNIESIHALFTANSEVFPTNNESYDSDIYQRHTVQFQWFNKKQSVSEDTNDKIDVIDSIGANCSVHSSPYKVTRNLRFASFDDYLGSFTARKRKNTKKERASIGNQGIEVRQLLGEEIGQPEIAYFYLAYQLTYMKKGHQPHLTQQFFNDIFDKFSDDLLLVMANKKENKSDYVACALFFFDDKTLYGRYWGCTENIKNLHFELCYYQGIEFCIKNNIATFNPGTQGEHKIKRGFNPIFTHSYHWIQDETFKPAIKAFCQQEQSQLKQYSLECEKALPFKHIST